MKSLRFLPAFLLLALVTFSSCKKDVEDRLPGDWDFTMTSTYSVSLAGVTQESDSDTYTGTITFKEDGTYILTSIEDGDTEVETGDWTATETTVILDDDLVFEIVTNKRKEQEWKISETETDEGIEVTYELTMKMEKQ